MNISHTLKLEELGMFLLGVYFFSTLSYDWWIFAALFFAPDLGMLGYLAGNKWGAFTYNLFHHKGLAIGLGLLGFAIGITWLELIGCALFSHAAFDRVLGYGLKYEKGFQDTHLGRIGKAKKTD